MTGDELNCGREFVAEVFAGLMSGKSYSPRVMAIYEALGGVKVPGCVSRLLMPTTSSSAKLFIPHKLSAVGNFSAMLGRLGDNKSKLFNNSLAFSKKSGSVKSPLA